MFESKRNINFIHNCIKQILIIFVYFVISFTKTMLKKISHIIMVTVLLVSTTGMTVSKHYCGGSLVDVNIFSDAKTCCDDIGTSKCCHNESEHIELDEDFLVVANDIQFQETTLDLLLPFIQSFVFNEIEQQDFETVNINPPPPKEVLAFLSDIQVYRL